MRDKRYYNKQVRNSIFLIIILIIIILFNAIGLYSGHMNKFIGYGCIIVNFITFIFDIYLLKNTLKNRKIFNDEQFFNDLKNFNL